MDDVKATNEGPGESPPQAEVPLPEIKEEFPERLDCPQCKRPYRVESLQTRVNTLLTETQLTCPRCRRRLHQMRLKDWYDHYVQGQKAESVPDVFRKSTRATLKAPKPLGPSSAQRREGSGQRRRRRRRRR